MNNQALPRTEIFHPGHPGCPGCAEALAIRLILKGIGPKAVAVIPASCIAIIAGSYPYHSLGIPVYQTALATTAIAAVGISRSLKIQGKEDVTVLGIAGDGGTFDIGLQALSAAAERAEDILYVCLDNEAYMNTGMQKSSATPLGAITTSTPEGKMHHKKDIIEIMAAHHLPYIATATPAYPDDLISKVQKASGMRGTKFIEVLSPCNTGWGFKEDSAVAIGRMAVESGVFPLYEIENGQYRLTHTPQCWPLKTYIQAQKRFAGITDETIAVIEANVQEKWTQLQMKAQMTQQRTLPV